MPASKSKTKRKKQRPRTLKKVGGRVSTESSKVKKTKKAASPKRKTPAVSVPRPILLLPAQASSLILPPKPPQWWQLKLRQFTTTHTWRKPTRRQLALAGIILGINFMVLSGVYLAYRRTILSFRTSPVVTAEAKLRTGEPSTITIDDLKLQLTVIPAFINDGIWETSDEFATHLATSARPGENGNVVIYGHNKNHIFSPLKQAKVGQTIRVNSNDGLRYEYEIKNILRVRPDQVEVVLPTDHEILTVYTCVGFLDSERLIIQALPKTQATL